MLIVILILRCDIFLLNVSSWHVVGLAITLAAVFSALWQRPLRSAVAEQSSATRASEWGQNQ